MQGVIRGCKGHSGFTRVSERRAVFRRDKSQDNANMPEILFPEKWWQMSQEDYNEAKGHLKGLIAKEADSGNAEVVYIYKLKG